MSDEIMKGTLYFSDLSFKSFYESPFPLVILSVKIDSSKSSNSKKTLTKGKK